MDAVDDVHAVESDPRAASVQEQRVLDTVALLEEWGFALPAHELCKLVHRGPIEQAVLEELVEQSPRLERTSGLVHRADADPGLLRRSRQRQRAHSQQADAFEEIALSYTRRLLRLCPWIRSVRLAGSLASGGFQEGDDIDLDLVVEDHTKYATYVLALLVSLPYAWRHRDREPPDEAWTPLLPKLVCLNVIWETSQAQDFQRTDAAMGMEIALSRSLAGHARFRHHLANNQQLLAHFPQLVDHEPMADLDPEPSRTGRFLDGLLSVSGIRRLVDGVCYHGVRALHALIRFARKRAPQAREHVERMKELKRPYAILDHPQEVD